MTTDIRVLADEEIDTVAAGSLLLDLVVGGVVVGAALAGVGAVAYLWHLNETRQKTMTNVNTSLAEVIEGGEAPPDPSGDRDDEIGDQGE